MKERNETSIAKTDFRQRKSEFTNMKIEINQVKAPKLQPRQSICVLPSQVTTPLNK